MTSVQADRPARGALRRHPDDPRRGPWLCNAATGCDEPATRQAHEPCGGCEEAAGGLQQPYQDAVDRLAAAQGQEQAVRSELAQRVDEARRRGEAPTVTAIERATLEMLAERTAAAQAEVERLQPEFTRLDDEHAHPVFSCETHRHLLPGEPEPAPEQTLPSPA